MTSAKYEIDQSAATGRPEGARVRPFLARAAGQPEPSVDADACATPRPDDVYLELGRLTAGLLEAQQLLLDSLERDEPDPDRLEQLFELDHLMAQVRRQADSVCVLAEGSTVRRPQELSLDEVLHAAESSVCDYRRVEIDPPASGRVVAAAAGELVHLITEVLDLALVTSAGRVLVSSRIVGDVVVIGVRDGGPASEPEEPAMDAAPADDAPQSKGLPTSARLRLINRLATRHDVRVDLRPGTDGAIVGSIVLPSTTLVEAPAVRELTVARTTPVRVAVVPLARAAVVQPPLPRHRRAGPPQGLIGRAV